MGKPDLAAYFKEWHGQRVLWFTGPLKGKQGTVTDVRLVSVDKHSTVFVNVLRDDGFLEPSVLAGDLIKIRDGNHELVKVDV